MIENPKNTSNRQDTIQRVQVGIVGLVAVLLLVSIANFVLQRASDEQTATEEIQADTTGMVPETASEVPVSTPKEPLAELGITPTRKPESESGKAAPDTSGINAQVVPDLEPDPKLEAPMDRER
ncbi:hypothetical protein AB1K62_00930 [Parasphingorhabdus sp. JC815]|uniref:hypothetical protein n=1 Tax=Parasphingorhabdus sp. JC815 TaxID=3232140 RepID=UPI003458A5F8